MSKLSFLVICIPWVFSGYIYSMNDKESTEIGRFTSPEQVLFSAAKVGNSKLINFLIKAGVNVNSRQSEYGIDDAQRPLHYAASSADNDNSAEIVKNLLEAGADPNVRDRWNWTPLHCAVTPPKWVLKPEFIDKADYKYDIIRYLLDAKADINVQQREFQTPLAKLIMAYGYNPEVDKKCVDYYITQVAKQLVKAGANINLPDSFGFLPIHLASSYERSELLKFLLEIKANPNSQTRQGDTPAMLLVNNSSETFKTTYDSIVALIKHQDIKLHIRNAKKQTIKDLLIQAGSKAIVDNKDYIDTLINLHDQKIATIQKELLDAIKSGDPSSLKKLLVRTTFHTFDAQGNNPLHWAASFGTSQIFSIILVCAPSLALLPNKQFKTPIDFIVSRPNTLEFLLLDSTVKEPAIKKRRK